MQPKPEAKKVSSQKAKDLSGNCPIYHDASTQHRIYPQQRQKAIEGCYGSSLMSSALTGSNRSQQIPPKSDKPNSKPMDDIKSTAYQNGVNRALKPKGGTWLYTLK